MASVSTYLNFDRQTEAAFEFYKSVFGGDFTAPGIQRMGDIPPQEGMPPLPEADKNLVMHVELPILGGHSLMGSDILDGMGHQLTVGNNTHINLQIDTRTETDQLFAKLADGGTVTMELADMFWGDYFGSCIDKFGIQWMINCPEKPAN
ncbi:VOC family protein [Marinoscillum furvescens]|uniref:PhnB protein n=1 Tax=Marinoscillum furvescens DSM 4134 TaxID=1122208 RepID=A0A3D9L131_MARFU|nr:VOC family protein [Marinoscillum furvescens]RED95585.1 PhnB protein [Marinoscillum furvescens DSM 4134]